MNVLLHACCGPCASACVPRLKADGHAVTMLFANDNIDTAAEFERRLAAARTLAAAEGVALVALPYDHDAWCAAVAAGFEDAPEKGERCARCFRYNLAKAAAYAREHGFDGFTTSLTVSPHKPSEMVFAAGEAVTTSVRQQAGGGSAGGAVTTSVRQQAGGGSAGEVVTTSVRQQAGGVGGSAGGVGDSAGGGSCCRTLVVPAVAFLREDFKKREGFKASVRRAGELGLYRQDYCGCEFSRFGALVRKYDAYVSTYRDADGKLPDMMQLKRTHTAFVVDNARRIARGEGFAPTLYAAALATALLHDTGRYEQLKRYNTFRDSDSVDHAVFSHDIVVEKGWLDGDEGERIGGGGQGKSERWRDAILAAVLYHNRREIPEGLDADTFALSHTVRDADKLDIFRVLEDQVAHTDWRSDSRAFWNLKVSAPPNPAVVTAIENHAPVDYQNIRALADFVLIQVGWMMNELHFATSRRLCAERGHLAFRRDFLHQLTDDPAVDRLCDLAARGLGK